MLPIVDFPTVVKDALEVFGGLFDNEPERRYFAEYLTGLRIAETKTVSGINREFAVTTDPSCLKRWLTEVTWDVTALNDRRLAWQVRSGEGQTRHVYLVSTAYSLLMRSLHQSRPQEWARTRLTTIGEACRAVKSETLVRMIDWVVDELTVEHWSVTDSKAVLAYS